jgi:hypothetical protein
MPGEYSQASLEAHFESINKRLRMIEEQLVRISETGGFTGANIEQARDVVVGL